MASNTNIPSEEVVNPPPTSSVADTGQKTYPEIFMDQLTGLHDLRKYTDIILKVEGQEFPSHRVILAAASNYFDTMFSSGLRESESDVIELESTDTETLTLVLAYIYSGKIEITGNNVQSLAQTADHFQLDALASDCEKFMISEMCTANCVGFYRFAKLYRREHLLHNALTTMLKNFADVFRSPELLELSMEDLIDYISDSELEVSTEDAVFEAVRLWVEADAENRKAVFPKVAAHIRFPFCSKAFLRVEVDTCHLMANPECQKYLNEARSYHWVPENRHQICTPRTVPRSSFTTQSCLVVLGGRLGNDSRNEKCFYLTSTNSAWQMKPRFQSPPTRGNYFSAVAIQNGIVVSGGISSAGILKDCWFYDLRGKIWNPMPSMHYPRACHASVVHNGNIYALGGLNRENGQHGTMITAEMLNQELQLWTQLPDMPKSLAYQNLVSYGRYIYVFGGVTRGVHSISTFAFNTVWKTWEHFKDMPKAVVGGGAVVVNDKVYVVGGISKSCLCYNIGLNSWTVLTKPEGKHGYAPATVWKGKILVVGGLQQQGVRSSHMEQYDPEKDEWTESPIQFPEGISEHQLLHVDLFDVL